MLKKVLSISIFSLFFFVNFTYSGNDFKSKQYWAYWEMTKKALHTVNNNEEKALQKLLTTDNGQSYITSLTKWNICQKNKYNQYKKKQEKCEEQCWQYNEYEQYERCTRIEKRCIDREYTQYKKEQSEQCKKEQSDTKNAFQNLEKISEYTELLPTFIPILKDKVYYTILNKGLSRIIDLNDFYANNLQENRDSLLGNFINSINIKEILLLEDTTEEAQAQRKIAKNIILSQNTTADEEEAREMLRKIVKEVESLEKKYLVPEYL